MNTSFYANLPVVIRTTLHAGTEIQVSISTTATACEYRVTVTNTTGGAWLCREYLAWISDGPAIQDALNTASGGNFAATSFQVSAQTVSVYSAPPTNGPIPFSPYVIIIPAVIVVLLFAVCLWMWCARPKIKRQERPVFDGFEMGDAQQLESSSNLEFAVPEVEFEDPRGGSKHRLTIN